MCARTRALAFLCAWSAPSQTRRVFFCKSGELQRCPGAIVFEIDTSNPRMILQHSSEHTRGCALCAKNRKVERGTACAAAKGGHGNAHPNAQNAVVLPEHFFLLELAHRAAAKRSSIRAHVPVCAHEGGCAHEDAHASQSHTHCLGLVQLESVSQCSFIACGGREPCVESRSLFLPCAVKPIDDHFFWEKCDLGAKT